MQVDKLAGSQQQFEKEATASGPLHQTSSRNIACLQENDNFGMTKCDRYAPHVSASAKIGNTS
jgi:hypothetical protein